MNIAVYAYNVERDCEGWQGINGVPECNVQHFWSRFSLKEHLISCSLTIESVTPQVHIIRFYIALRGSPCNNRPLKFREITEFFHTFCVKKLTHEINKKRGFGVVVSF